MKWKPIASGSSTRPKAGYQPDGLAHAFKVFKQQESFELQRAKDEGSEPNIYHGVFSDHPAPDERVVWAVQVAAKVTTEPANGWVDNRDAWTVKNLQDRIMAYTKKKDSLWGSIQTMRHLKPSEYPLAEPYRVKIPK